MRIAGELCLLAAFVAAGFATFACLVGDRSRYAIVIRAGLTAAIASIVLLTTCVAVVATALLTKDFAFDYVAKYSSQKLEPRYSLSALWVGQAGSLLLWGWMTAVLGFVFRFVHRHTEKRLADLAFGLLMGYVCFLTAVMVFAADPMKGSIVAAQDGAGLSPLLQHPAMMIHPPIVFAGYAASTLLFALAFAALIVRRADLNWVSVVRPWAILTWLLLGTGILLGANWAYEELGWGGYWGWDPVENGSLMPWLTCTVFIHSLLVWRYRDGLKKTAFAMAITTFGLCNFATFLTRSGIFSSLHAFSQSPIGWMFLVLMLLLAIAGGVLVVRRREMLASTMQLCSLWARETYVVVAGVALVLLTVVVLIGTVLLPASTYMFGTKAVVGPEFYNAVLAPIGLLLLATTVAVPLLQWGGPPNSAQRRLLLLSLSVGVASAMVGFIAGIRSPVALIVVVLAAAAPVALVSALLLEIRKSPTSKLLSGSIYALRKKRRTFAGFVIHLGFVAVAIGVTGSSLGTQRLEVVMHPGESLEWAGRRIRYEQLNQSELPDKLVAAAQLYIDDGGQLYILRPARHFHLLQEQWTTEVDIHSSWSGDFYTILNNGEGNSAVSLTFVEMPLMRWLWLGGGVSGIGVITTLWPVRRNHRARQQTAGSLIESATPTAQPVRRRAA